MQHDEQDLIEQARHGSRDAFRLLVQRYQRRVYALAYGLTGCHHDAEDVAQEVFVKAWQALPDFRGEAQLGSWLHRITVTTFLNSRRRTREEAQDELAAFEADAFSTPDFETNPGYRVEANGVQQHVQAALETLSPTQRAVFVLRHQQELSTREVAEALDVAEGTVKVQLHRAIAKLRDVLAFYQDPEPHAR